ncbi:sigma factor binding protein 1, chloroplastic-like [Aristolochia californica]|uniref:sigma factor binding protein 1, chloroplastic-like n=1 Tax=Aristolochia californica TaxID=171875 RepID=UPI0035D9A3E6
MGRLAVHPKKTNKSLRSKKKQIKVVYISNPMKVKASASEFRALVQELTGQDSDPAEMAKFFQGDGLDEQLGPQNQPSDDQYEPSMPVPFMQPVSEPSRHVSNPFDSLDDVFTPQMVESFNGFFPSSILYESQMEMLRSFDAV